MGGQSKGDRGKGDHGKGDKGSKAKPWREVRPTTYGVVVELSLFEFEPMRL